MIDATRITATTRACHRSEWSWAGCLSLHVRYHCTL